MYQDPMAPRQEPTIPVSQPFQPPTQAASQPFYPPPPPPPPPSYYPSPSQPLYQPFPQPAKKSNTALKIGIVALIFIVCIVATAAIAYQAGKNSASLTTGTTVNLSDQNTPGAGTTPVSTTSSSQPHYKVGDQVQANGWLIVVTKAQTSNGDDVFQPGAGNIFVEVDLSLQNQTSQSQDVNIFDFTLRAQDGTPYMAALSNLPDITGTIVAGGKDRGGIDFEVPQADKTFTLEFVPGFEGVAAIWDIHV